MIADRFGFSRLIILAGSCLLALLIAPVKGLSAADRPRLVVVVSVDQLAQEYLERFQKGFSEQGIFNKFRSEGAWFTQCHHRHAFTITGPGHSVMLTGAYPSRGGIVANSWLDRASGKMVYCVFDDQAPLLGGTGNGVSPRNLLVSTVGDQLRKETDSQAKVVGIAIKDRSAVLMAGHHPNAVYWYDSGNGNFISSRYYCEELPVFMQQFNDGDAAEQFSSRTWNLIYSSSQYKLHRPDDYRYEGTAYGVGRSFPHQLAAADDASYYKQLTVTPYGNELLLQAAREIVVHHKLGKDKIPDLLVVGLSANDPLGHNFGPFSLEVEDMTYRTDLLLGQFCRFLDKQVGHGQWTIVLTADHGVAPIPEYGASIGLDAKRNPLGSLKELQQQLESKLIEKLGPRESDSKSQSRYIIRVEANQVYFNRGPAGITKKDFSTAQIIVQKELEKHPAIASVATREELLQGKKDDKIFRQMQRAFHPDRSGDLLFVLRPYQIQSNSPATHGSPWPHDTHVPMLWLGCGVQAGKFDTATSPAAIAPTIARLLGLKPIATVDEKPLLEALKLENQ